VKQKCTSAAFDDVFFFNGKGLEEDEVRDMTVKIDVQDADIGSRYDPIGACYIDIADVYVLKNHEIYRAWYALTSEDTAGVQGYIQLSVTAIGPGDTAPVHDLEKEMREEGEKEAEGFDLASMCKMPANVQLKPANLVVCIHKADGIPAMDGGLKTSGTDGFIQLVYGDIPRKMLRTKVWC
jgi:hypothetical protein